MKKLLFCLVLLLSFSLNFASEVLAQTYVKYENTHYGFEILYPNTLIPQGESDSKDGQMFISADKKASLSAYNDRSNNLINEDDTNLSFEQYYKRETKNSKKRQITYKTFSKKFFVVSGTENNKIFYRKTIDTENGWFTFELIYENTEKDVYNKACGIIGTSFK
jgi:hypothetical protein